MCAFLAWAARSPTARRSCESAKREAEGNSSKTGGSCAEERDDDKEPRRQCAPFLLGRHGRQPRGAAVRVRSLRLMWTSSRVAQSALRDRTNKMIHDDNVRLSYLGGTVANREAQL